MYSTKKYLLETNKTECLILPVFESKKLSGIAARINKLSDGFIKSVLDKGDFTGKTGQSLLLYNLPGIKAERVLLAGAGKKKALTTVEFTRFASLVINQTGKTSATQSTVLLEEINIENKDSNWQIQQFIKQHAAASYNFSSFKSKKVTAKKGKLCFGFINEAPAPSLNKTVKSTATLVKAIAVSKDLGNLPGNVCTPSYLAKEARKLAGKHTTLACKVIGEKEIEKLGMGAFTSVTKGSDQEGKLIILHYRGAKKETAPHVLVGKGITFDSGGISLKPGAAMDEMKYDMCGAATVFGTMQAVTELGLNLNIIGVIVAAENMPGGGASKPGDIVKTLSGQTVEVLNTDAEGRLVLCDALTYVERFKPASVVDVATLTGACVIALGNHATAVFSNDEALSQELCNAGENAGDKAWPMPLWDEYQNLINSPFADMANIGGRNAGSITAACFLSRYTKSYKWAHMDIAGTAWNGPGPNKGATGRPVALLTRYLMDKKA